MNFLLKQIENYFATRKNKRYGKDAIDYEMNWVVNVVETAKKKLNRDFDIKNNYAFLVSTPKWREIFATEFEGRRADHEICDRLYPFIEQELSPRTFNNRIGMGVTKAILNVYDDIKRVSENYTKNAWIIKVDMKGFFPNARWDIAYNCLEKIIDKYIEDEEELDYLKWLTKLCLYCDPARNFTRKTPEKYWDLYISPEKSIISKPEGIGAAIGRLIWQTAMGLYINDEIKWLDSLNYNPTCFVDDIVLIVPEALKKEALNNLLVLRQKLGEKGVTLNEKKFYCLPYYRGLEFLGSHIKKNRIYLNNSTLYRAFNMVKKFNALKNKINSMDKFQASINSYLGLLKTHNNLKLAYKLLLSVDKLWWKYFMLDTERICLVFKLEYTKKYRLNKKYNLKLKGYDICRKNKQSKRPH